MFRFLGNLKSTPLILLLGFALALGFTSCDSADDVGPPPGISGGQPDMPGASASAKAAKPGDATLVQIAIDSGFNELVAALTYVDENIPLDTGLVELFSDTLQFTIFAPTDDAFLAFYDSLGVGGITELPAETVLDVLLYHVTNGRRISASVVPPRRFKTIQTLLNEKFIVDTEANIDAIGSEAAIVQPDISASNGIIHVIDGVLKPFE
jgi:uncharacterized surface protein with fasciclin (FAS1) repeats